jgi:hypothetical protein
MYYSLLQFRVNAFPTNEIWGSHGGEDVDVYLHGRSPHRVSTEKTNINYCYVIIQIRHTS